MNRTLRNSGIKEESALELSLKFQLDALGHDYVREYRFAREELGTPTKGIREGLAAIGLKDWRFDFAFKHEKIAVECEGGVFSNGRHTRGKGFEEDCEKYNQATLLGWKIFRFTGGQIKSGRALGIIDKALNNAHMARVENFSK